MGAKVTWNGKMGFTGTAGTGFDVPMDSDLAFGGENTGFRPMELIAVGLAGCTGMDVISILSKKRQDVTAFEVRTETIRAEEHPRIFTHILLEYIVTGRNLDSEAVARAVELSQTKYCPASAMLGKAAKIESKITIIDAVDA